MIRIGLTGGIGSGKSTITQLLTTIGVPVYISDIRSKQLTQSDPTIISGLKRLLGDDIYSADGLLNKKKMAQMIFNDKDLLAQVNGLIHPVVHNDFDRWAEEQGEAGVPYVVNEAAIMIENGGYKRMDKVIVVTAPLEQRIARTMARDNASREQVISRINNQMSDEEKVKYADFVITTDDKHFIIPEILKIHNELIK